MGANQSTEANSITNSHGRSGSDALFFAGGNGIDLSALHGFHVLKIKPNSPAELAGLSPYFDFIVAVDGQTNIDNLQDFAAVVSKFVNKELLVTVFSLKTRRPRDVKIKPYTGWGTQGNKDGLLGCSVRYSSIEAGLECVWHILEIHPRSPAERGGLQAHSDYVVGCEYKNLEAENDFYDLIAEHEGKLLSLLVYNIEWDSIREVLILPKPDWGGEGLLGCGVGYGLLHRIPIQELPAPKRSSLIPPDMPITSPVTDSNTLPKAKDESEEEHIVDVEEYDQTSPQLEQVDISSPTPEQLPQIVVQRTEVDQEVQAEAELHDKSSGDDKSAELDVEPETALATGLNHLGLTEEATVQNQNNGSELVNNIPQADSSKEFLTTSVDDVLENNETKEATLDNSPRLESKSTTEQEIKTISSTETNNSIQTEFTNSVTVNDTGLTNPDIPKEHKEFSDKTEDTNTEATFQTKVSPNEPLVHNIEAQGSES